MNTTTDLNAIARRAEKATATGNWRVETVWPDGPAQDWIVAALFGGDESVMPELKDADVFVVTDKNFDDAAIPAIADFIAHAHEDIPALLAEVERLRKEVEGEQEARYKADAALRAKDRAMGVLFGRLRALGDDCEDLIP